MNHSRRLFLQQASLAAAGLLLPGGISAFANSNGLPKRVGIQLYTMRDQLDKNPKDTLTQIAKIGYQEVETYYGTPGVYEGKFWGVPVKELKSLLSSLNLTSPSGHYGLNSFLTAGDGKDDELKAQVDYAAELGQKYFVIPALPFPQWDATPTADHYKFIAEQLNKAAEYCKKSGLHVAFHNHFWEFKPLADQPGSGYEVMLKHTDPGKVFFELDLFWAIKSGYDPVKLFAQAPGRFFALHVKDIDKARPEVLVSPATKDKKAMELLSMASFADVGTGAVDFKRILAKAPAAGVKHLYVEQDVIKTDHFQSITNSYGYVKNTLLK
ncbi:sugar phosphate isomerase/epimerase [Chitinophaga sp. sic0106]|uniref:sugar phosphate isomerase/epimerase family protein n=1 Tax=Chitinophaga sp. sic0106 TaxID=2854785 RepID=UPI001C454C2E|nr:sugar phosphate isomerase/epimerase [Chitinophaga sp. sic0106]MBV7529079.1 sugar phosphate isomerase/epimerase [Chitinophaga sp. sic0106]